MMAGDAMAVVEASREGCDSGWDPFAGPEWTMPVGWLTALTAALLATCVVIGLAV